MNGLKTVDTPEEKFEKFKKILQSSDKTCFKGSKAWAEIKDNPNKQLHVKQIEDKWNQALKDYPQSGKQPILDGQPIDPIARNTAIGMNAMCDSIIQIAESP